MQFYEKPKGVEGGVRPDLPIKWVGTRRKFHQKFVVSARKLDIPINIKYFNDRLEINSHKLSLDDTWASAEAVLKKK